MTAPTALQPVLLRLAQGAELTEDEAEQQVAQVREDAHADDERDGEQGGRDPLLAGRPRDAPHLRRDAADDVLCARRGRRPLCGGDCGALRRLTAGIGFHACVLP